MKNFLLLSTILLQTIFASAQKFEWLTCTEGPNIYTSSQAQSNVAVDAAGNIYTCGMYGGGTLILGNDTLISYGNADLFLAKMDTAGNYLWAKSIGNSSNDDLLGITIDGNNNLYIACYNYLGGTVNTGDTFVFVSQFSNIFSFDTSGTFRWFISSHADKITAAHSAPGFYTIQGPSARKFDDMGNMLWQKTATFAGSGIDFKAIAVNDDNKLALTLSLIFAGSGNVFFDTVTVPYNTASIGAKMVFLCDTSGSALWGREFAGNTTTDFYVPNVEVRNGTGEVYVGAFGGNSFLLFANDTIVNPISVGNGWDAILKYSALGNPQWARAYYAGSGNNNSNINDITINAAGEIIFCGGFTNSNCCIFGPFNLPFAGVNSFIGKLSDSGNYMWAKVDTRNNDGWRQTRTTSISCRGGMNYVAGGTYLCSFFPLYNGCNNFTPGIHIQGHFFTLISENTEPVPVADFSILQSGNTVLFKNTTTSITSASWNFGDASTSTQQQPIHNYAQPGVYIVSLTASNSCGSGMKTDTVIVKGIRQIVTNHGTNNGVVTAEIFGGGFTSTTTVLLKKTGNPDIAPIITSFINAGRMLLRFNFTGQTIGAWDVEVTVPGDTIMTLVNGFILEAQQPYSFEVTVKAPSMTRTGRWAPSEYSIYNKTNEDAVGVQVMFRVNSALNEFDSQPFIQPQQDSYLNSGLTYLQNNSIVPDMLSKYFMDAGTNSLIGAFIIPMVKANSSFNIKTYLRSGAGISFYNGAFAINPLLTSSALVGSNVPLTDICFSEFLKRGIEQTFSISIPASAWNNCYSSLNDSLLAHVALLANNQLVAEQPVSHPAFITAMLTQLTATGCVSGIPSVLTGMQIKSVIDKSLANFAFLDDISQITPNCAALNQYRLDNTVTNKQIMTNEFCDIVGGFGPGVFSVGLTRAKDFCENFGNSCDPNRKSGPGDNANDIWQNPSDLSSYVIAFENVDTATTRASVVTVIDTLDVSRFDFSTFHFSGITISDSLNINFDTPDLTQVKLTPLTPPATDYLRTEASFDTATGIIKWIFTTVDNVNFQPDTNPVNGFLSPNANGTEGTGYVSYDVYLKSNLVTGDSVINTSNITFDNNAPIHTNNWLNVIDITKPQSAVSSLPPNVNTASFLVSWSGTDAIAGIRSYTVYVSENDLPYELWLSGIDSTQYTFNGIDGHKYEFFSKATDRAGNIEDAPLNPDVNPDAVTMVVVGIEEIEGVKNISLYPNPASQSIHFSYELTENSFVGISMFDILGSNVSLSINEKQNAGRHQKQIDLSGSSEGIYLLKMNVNGNELVKKIIKL